MYSLFLTDPVWEYLSETQKDLIREGDHLIKTVEKYQFKDYSFLVFPFAKAYEGYLKQLFLDIGFITHEDYISDHFRVGKFLSPHLMHRLGNRSIYAQIRTYATADLAEIMWEMWTEGRNKVFHYYPHNLRKLSYVQSQELDDQFLHVIERSYKQLKLVDIHHFKALQ